MQLILKDIERNGETYCKKQSLNLLTHKASEIIVAGHCNEHNDSNIRVFHLATKELGKDRSKMDDKWKKANNDAIFALLDVDSESSLYHIKNPFIAFKDYKGGDLPTQFFVINMKSEFNLDFHHIVLDGYFYVDNTPLYSGNIDFLDKSGEVQYDDMGEGIENIHYLTLDYIDTKYIELIKYMK
ncbi:hypothetical protein DCO59_09515 [Helicobacter saguini]|uniref:hypothetical protein n=1 Tax=Helicobacter saguini TaxID=1548018 RepID=UPI00136B13DE|nr:hypothetical protein [Helicobacter saguini]MWV72565.1 hypothetical protein [Helicobacter saguini]